MSDFKTAIPYGHETGTPILPWLSMDPPSGEGRLRSVAEPRARVLEPSRGRDHDEEVRNCAIACTQ